MNLYQYFPYHSFNRTKLGRICLFWYRQFPVVTILKQKVGNCLFLLSIYNDDPFHNTNTPFFLQIPQTKLFFLPDFQPSFMALYILPILLVLSLSGTIIQTHVTSFLKHYLISKKILGYVGVYCN